MAHARLWSKEFLRPNMSILKDDRRSLWQRLDEAEVDDLAVQAILVSVDKDAVFEFKVSINATSCVHGCKGASDTLQND